MIAFRPYPVMTVLAAAALAVLCVLGWWQLERLTWKLDLIAAVEARVDAEPLPIDELIATQDPSLWEYAPVSATGRFDHSREVHVFGQNLGGQIGWFIFTPLIREGAAPVIVNRGFVPQALKDPLMRAEGQVAGVVTVTGLARQSGSSNAFSPPPNFEVNEWYVRDRAAMASHMGVGEPVSLVIDSREDAPGGWPQGGQTRLEFTNSHLGYALTWFGLALTMIGVYIAYHWQKGRIGPKGNS